MHTMFQARIRIALHGIMLLGIIASALGFSAATTVRAREAGSAPPLSGSGPDGGQEQSRSGWFAILWGDASQGKARTLYTLTDENGQTTFLQMDETLAQSLGGVLSLNRKYVSVARGSGGLFRAGRPGEVERDFHRPSRCPRDQGFGRGGFPGGHRVQAVDHRHVQVQ